MAIARANLEGLKQTRVGDVLRPFRFCYLKLDNFFLSLSNIL